MMKHILIIWFCLLSMYPYVLYAEDANAQQYQDSILKIAQSMPGTLHILQCELFETFVPQVATPQVERVVNWA